MQTLTERDPDAWLAAHSAGQDSDEGHTDTGQTNVVEVEGLTKRFKGTAAVDNLSFTVPAGSVAGLIGPNGAGKTTLMAMLLGLVRPTAGTGEVLGRPLNRPAEYLGRVGASIESPAFHPSASGFDNLRSLAVLGGHDEAQIPDLIERVGLGGRSKDRYGSYSLGMKQRLAIAASLLGDPQLVILDEPTNGLDPLGMQEVRGLIGELAAEGRTVLVSSHLLSELEQVCDWLIVIDHGGLVYLGRPDELASSETIVLRPTAAQQLPTLHAIASSTGLTATATDAEVVITVDEGVDPVTVASEINRQAHQAGIALSELHHDQAGLEARYLSVLATWRAENPAITTKGHQS